VYVDPILVKSLVVALCVTVSTIFALLAGILIRHAGAHRAEAMKGGATFAGALALALSVVTVLGVR
jgi:hypothetical protein